MLKAIFTYLLLVLSSSSILSQISIDKPPASAVFSVRTSIEFIEIDAQRTENQALEASVFPLYAGYTLPFPSDFSHKGVWVSTAEGVSIWRIGIEVDGAKQLNLYFRDIDLQTGDYLYIYDPNQDRILGAFSSRNNGTHMGTALIDGQKLILEFNTTNKELHLPFILHEIGIVTHSDKNIRGGFGDAGYCEIPINCSEGNNWQEQKDGVARVFVKKGDALAWCSGSLVNNTRNDGTPYFLTANHCGQYADETDYANWVFYFNYEGPYCETPLDEPEEHTISGASLLASSPTATSAGSDFKLLLLMDEVPKSYHPYYNGWDRTANPSSSGVVIHHPQGDIKMISTYKNPTISSQYYGNEEDLDGFYWKVAWNETANGQGVTEGGSSGSPLFSKDGLIMGALTGGTASCSLQDEPDYFGKFSVSWDGVDIDSTTKIQPWLDPDNSGVLTLSGSTLDSTELSANFVAGPTNIIVGERVEFTNLSYGNIESYQWFFEGGDPAQALGDNPPQISYASSGDYDVSLVVSSGSNSDTLIRRNYIHVSPSISPNPGSGLFRIGFGQEQSGPISLQLYDLLGRNIYFQEYENSENGIVLDLSWASRGLYLLLIQTNEGVETQKVIVSK